MVSVSFRCLAPRRSARRQHRRPANQPGRERERFERPPVPLAQPGGPASPCPARGARGRGRNHAGGAPDSHRGRDVYTSAQLAELYADLIGHRVTLQAVYDAAGRITPNTARTATCSRAPIIPVQELDPNGAVVRIQVLEGYVETVEWPGPARRLSRFLFPTTRRGSPPNGR